MPAFAAAAPSSHSTSSHIHLLPQEDATVLSACAEFPTFSDALATVAQAALPALESEVWNSYVSRTRRSTLPSSEKLRRCRDDGKQHPSKSIAALHGPSVASAVAVERTVSPHGCHLVSNDVSVSLPACSWSIERCVALPIDSDDLRDLCQRHFDHAREAPYPQQHKRNRMEGATIADAASRSAPLHAFRRLASICADVSVSVWCVAPHVRHSDHQVGDGIYHSGQGSISAFHVCVERRWHGGQETSATAPISRQTRRGQWSPANCGKQRWCSACKSDGVLLVSRCCVRGLFGNLPLRQSAFKVTPPGVLSSPLLGPPNSSSRWAETSAAAQRTRREEQRHLLTVLFQTALCTVLAPLYLQANSCTPRDATETMEPSPVFTAHLFTESAGMWSAVTEAKRGNATVGETARRGPSVAPLQMVCQPVTAAVDAYTDDSLSAHPAKRGTLEGLSCDRYGLHSGFLVAQQMRRQTTVKQSPSERATQAPLPFDEALRSETCGEATARELCDVFCISRLFTHASSTQKQPTQKSHTSSSAASPCGKQGADVYPGFSRFTEVVVRCGRLAVLFHTSSNRSPSIAGTPVSPAAPLPRTLLDRSPYFSQSLHFTEGLSGDRQHPVTFLIIVGDQGASHAESSALCTSAPLPSYRVLDPDHWAYDVVTVHSRSLRSRFGSFANAFPVFIFVDAVYVPAHLYENRQRRGKPERAGSKQREASERASLPSSFTELYAEAVECLCARRQPAASAEVPGVQPREEPPPPPPPQPAPPYCSQASVQAARSAPASDAPTHALHSAAHASPAVDMQGPAAAAPTCNPTLSSLPCGRSGRVRVRMQYVFQRILQAAAAPGMQAILPSSSTNPPPSLLESEGSDFHGAAAPTSLHRVRLTSETLWRNATSCGGRAADSASAYFTETPAALSRRTPVSLHPKLAAVIQEEKGDGSVQAEHAAAIRLGNTNLEASTAALDEGHTTVTVEERMARMRHLLDTGRGSVLRQLPRACKPPQSWAPVGKETADARGAARCSPALTPPIGSAQLTHTSVLPWARKFILVAQRLCTHPETAPSPNRRSAHEEEVEEASALLPPGEARCLQVPLPFHAFPQPHHRRWWVLDQHAVHERVRLEFFLCFADTYVCHPELQRTVATHRSTEQRNRKGCDSGAVSAISVLSNHAHRALERRQQNTRLLQKWEKKTRFPSCLAAPTSFSIPQTPPFTAFLSFPVLIPADWRLRVTLVEPHLLQWGWRFQHELEVDSRHPSLTSSYQLTTAVLSWPCLEVEGVEHRITSLRALADTVEELEALGGASATPASSSLPMIPSVLLRFFISRSCRGAIMFGDAVTPAAARHMVAALEHVEQYYTCSHGRPSFASLAPFKA
ncbi:hypothetical protein ABL78_6994 [Leptomonas seymouri]|uniref:MutL C-terminal dimerisation domain-containing protein n=1 Tax=Leptomonas seymouri TaxID=5684 RepID=A0A0N1I053_LEPSE|nr:hypothetical protein ABL78_6994 [Leptomonas seymouri]|eukprot:KPI83963.1 hypothetical protein ABL78_6994 [Leptomonas seymouri]